MSIPAAIPAEQTTRRLSTKRRPAWVVVFGAVCRSNSMAPWSVVAPSPSSSPAFASSSGPVPIDRASSAFFLGGSGWCALLGCCGCPGERVGIAQLQPGHVDDLLRVTPEMRNTVEDRRYPGHVETLNASDFSKLPGIDTSQDTLRFLDDGIEAAHQRFFR